MIRALLFAMIAALALLVTVRAGAITDPARAPADAESAVREGKVAFCKDPPRPLSRRARRLCPAAAEIKGCEAFVAACKEAEPKPSSTSTPSERRSSSSPPPDLSVPSGCGAAAQVFVWLIVLAAIFAIAIPIIRAILKARDDKKVADVLPPRAVETDAPKPVVIPDHGDAEQLLRAAEEHARRGQHDIALQLYLAAALRALDKRGAIRLSKDRTNGEYVRGCKDDNAKTPLREIVREVDKVQFGGERADVDAVSRAGSRATSLVRATFVALSLFLLCACGGSSGTTQGSSGGRDPAGDELVLELLERQGMKATRLGSALASLPIPKDGESVPAVIVDADESKLDDDTRAHLLRWVEAGGALILAGSAESWPAELKVKRTWVSPNDVLANAREVAPIPPPPATHRPRVWNRDEEDWEDPPFAPPSPKITRAPTPPLRAKVELHAALDWPATPKTIAWYDESYAVYAASIDRGKGRIIGVATDELFTNAGAARASNAAVLIAIVGEADRIEVKVARPEDGIAPPSNPVSGMQRAGLGLGLWHALAAALVLFFAVGVRIARPRPAAPPTRRAFTEHVEATGALYARTRVAPHALACYARYADERLRARMPRGTTDIPAFLAARSGVDVATCERVWNRARAAKTDESPRGDELETLKALSSLTSAALS